MSSDCAPEYTLEKYINPKIFIGPTHNDNGIFPARQAPIITKRRSFLFPVNLREILVPIVPAILVVLSSQSCMTILFSVLLLIISFIIYLFIRITIIYFTTSIMPGRVTDQLFRGNHPALSQINDHQPIHDAEAQKSYFPVVSSRNSSAYRLIVLGDSVVEGVGCDFFEETLSAQLAKYFAMISGAAVEFYALGKSGYTAAKIKNHLIQRIPIGLEGPKINIICINNGVNHLTRLHSTVRYERELKQLITAIRAVQNLHSAPLFVFGLPPVLEFPIIPFPLNYFFDWRATNYNRSTGQICRGFHSTAQPTFFVPFPDLSLDYWQKKVKFKQLFAADKLHPSPLAIEVSAQIGAARMLEMLRVI
jgi:lysophospholipase L1-like esterase